MSYFMDTFLVISGVQIGLLVYLIPALVYEPDCQWVLITGLPSPIVIATSPAVWSKKWIHAKVKPSLF